MDSNLITLTDIEQLKAKTPFKSEGSARWAFRHRHENGLHGAFIRIGRKILIDPAKLHELARQNVAS